jgi:hypothetical protein
VLARAPSAGTLRQAYKGLLQPERLEVVAEESAESDCSAASGKGDRRCDAFYSVAGSSSVPGGPGLYMTS